MLVQFLPDLVTHNHHVLVMRRTVRCHLRPVFIRSLFMRHWHVLHSGYYSSQPQGAATSRRREHPLFVDFFLLFAFFFAEKM